MQTLGTNPTERFGFMSGDSASKENEGTVTMESRYGPVEVNLKQAIFFPKGILGMPDMKDFCVTNLPDPKLGKFKLLQSVNDEKLSFVVLPIDADGKPFEKRDIEECCEVTQIDKDNLLLLAIVSVQRTPESVIITANMRAPIVVDAKDKLAIQYVFPSNRYEIRHRL